MPEIQISTLSTDKRVLYYGKPFALSFLLDMSVSLLKAFH